MSDIPLKHVQVIWDPEPGHDLDPIRIAHYDEGHDDPRYYNSWGASDQEFNQADDAGKLSQLLALFVALTARDGLGPRAVHDAFLDIPEYRQRFADIAPELTRTPYRSEDDSDG